MRTGNGHYSGRSVAAAFAGGAATALIASRLLPPVAAMATGSARLAAGDDPFESLLADHRRFLDLLTDMGQSASKESFRRTQLLLRLKRGLAAHAMAEEDVVYPLLHDAGEEEHDAKQLYSEHAEMKLLLYRLEETPKDAPAWAGHASALHRLIEEHARHEEEIDFPKLRAILDETETARLARNLHREKALVL